MNQREKGVERLKPSFYNSRYYYLNQLSSAIAEVLEAFFESGKKEKREIFDYGCGNSPYKELFPKEYQYIKGDISPDSEPDILLDPEGMIPSGRSSFDYVLSTQVLEHVEDPKLYLKEACRVLKKDGMLILTTHGIWMYHPDPTDFWRWTCDGLKKVVIEAGFEIIAFRGILGRSAMGLQLFQDGIIFKLPKKLRFLVAIPMQMLIWLADQINSQAAKDRDACTYILVAKKTNEPE